MARNDDRARNRRAKRRGEDPEADAPQDPLTPASGQPEAGEPAEPELGETLRAEEESHAALVGSPVGFGDPVTEDTPDSAFVPDRGGEVVGGESTHGGGPRLFRFFRASWQELQRVRWPDRAQVGQGTAVTLGFVVIAGAFLGVADVVARELVNLII